VRLLKRVQDQPELHQETLSQKQKQINEKPQNIKKLSYVCYSLLEKCWELSELTPIHKETRGVRGAGSGYE
jgi:hypothetical protein